MPLYKCLIRGENFPGLVTEKAEPIGFYTTRYVQAASPAAAELAVVEALRADPKLQLPDGHPKPTDAKVFVDEIKRVFFRRGGHGLLLLQLW